MMYYYGYPYMIDPTYILVLMGVVISLIASANVKRSFNKYSRVFSSRGIRAEQAAEMILKSAGVQGVTIRRVSGNLTDHYDPGSRVLCLSDSVYGSGSIAAIGVAAHECGHAIQHASAYTPLSIRSALVPVVNLASKVSMPLIVLGLILGFTGLAQIGVILFSAALLFQLVTLPVEFDASSRAVKILDNLGILYGDEVTGARRVLRAAALTYVAAVISTALQLLRLIMIVNRRND